MHMSHPFGDLIAHHLHRKHGLSQSKLAAGILQAPSVITDMCQGKRLQGRQARERVVAILTWLQRQGVLDTIAEASALLAAAGMAALRATEPLEAALLQQISTQSATHYHSSSITVPTNLPTSVPRFSSRRKESATHNLPAQLKKIALGSWRFVGWWMACHWASCWQRPGQASFRQRRSRGRLARI
jgi:hypothetical protein